MAAGGDRAKLDHCFRILIGPMSLLSVSLSDAAFGYGPDGAIVEIADPLPETLWAHPANAWSPLIR